MDRPNEQQENAVGKQENDVGKQENDVAAKPEQKTEELKTAEDYEAAAFNAMKRPAGAAGAAPKVAAGAKKPKANNGPKTTIAKKPAAKTGPAKGKKLQIGCKKCRGNGCSTCMNPSFGGWRGNHAQWCKLGLKHHP